MYHETTKNWVGSSEYDEQHKHKHAKEGEALNSNTIQNFLRWMIHIWGLVFTSNSYLQPCLENRHLTLRFGWFSLSLDTHSGLNLCIFLAVFVEKIGSLLVKRNRINHEQSKQTTRSNNVSNQPKKHMGFTNPPLMTPLSTDMTPRWGDRLAETLKYLCGLNGIRPWFWLQKKQRKMDFVSYLEIEIIYNDEQRRKNIRLWLYWCENHQPHFREADLFLLDFSSSNRSPQRSTRRVEKNRLHGARTKNPSETSYQSGSCCKTFQKFIGGN